VRVTNLQELVYKQGQAGINKATVSVTFHNDDRENGPAGYQDKEYIVVTRQVQTLALGACSMPHECSG
jgi:structural maintenance of chromosome 2